MSTDDTTQLAAVHTPLALTAETEASAVEALMADIDERVRGLRRLIGSRGDASARAALSEEIGRLVSDALQLDAHLAETDRASRDAAADAVLAHLERAEGEG